MQLETQLQQITEQLKLHRMQDKMARLYHQKRKKECEAEYVAIQQMMQGYCVLGNNKVFRPTTQLQRYILQALLALSIQRFVLVLDLDYQMVIFSHSNSRQQTITPQTHLLTFIL